MARREKPGRSLRTRLTVTVLVCWTVPALLISLVSARLSDSSLRTRLDASLQEGASFAAQQTMNTLDSVIELSRRATADDVFYGMYLDRNVNLESPDVYQSVRWSLYRTFVRSNAVDMALLYYLGHEDAVAYHINSRKHSTAELPEHYKRSDSAGVREAAQKSGAYISFYKNENRLYVIRNVLTPDTFQPFATLVILVDADMMAEPFGHTGLTLDSLTLRLADYIDAGEIYLAGKPFEPGDLPTGAGQLWREGDNAWFSRMIRTGDYTLSFMVGADYLVSFPELAYAQRAGIALMLGVAPLLIFMLNFLHKQVTRPVQELIRVAGCLEREEFGVQTRNVGGSSEFLYLSNAFDKMSARLQELFERSYQEELMLRDARISALQSQMNPHFFNNTLELINWQARRNGDEMTSKMVESLGTLVGASIDRANKPTVPLYEEMDYVDAYLYITSVRYGKRLSVSREIDESLLDEPVPILSLQTLLENAVVHGIEQSSAAGLTLRVFRESGCMVIEVENTGALSEKDRAVIDEILATCEGIPDDTGRRRVGLANVYKRLLLLYNDRQALRYRCDGQSTVFILTLPLNRRRNG